MIIIIVLLVTEKPVQVKLTMIWPTCSFVQFNIFTYECEVVAYILTWEKKEEPKMKNHYHRLACDTAEI